MTISAPAAEGRSVPAAKFSHLRYLDALRGMASLGVVLSHWAAMFPSEAPSFCAVGSRGVQLFYLVSAFTLCYSHDVRQSYERFPLGNYFIRRFFRIAPLYYVALIGNLMIHGFRPWWMAPNGITLFDVFLAVVFLNGFSAQTINAIVMGGWSVAVETSFYVVFPFIIKRVRNVQQAALLFGTSAIFCPIISQSCYLLTKGEGANVSSYFHYFWVIVEFPVFCLGILSYFIWKTYIVGNELIGGKPRRVVAACLLVGSGAIFLLPLSYIMLYPCSIALSLILLGLAAYPFRFLVNPILGFVGKISYSIYLTHFFCMLVVECLANERSRGVHLIPHTTLFLYLSLPLLLASVIFISTITYYGIEKPGMRLGGYLIALREKKSIPSRL